MKTKSLSQKLILCLLAGLVCGAAFRRIGARFLPAVPYPIILTIAIAMLISAIVGGIVWHNREREGRGNTERTNAFWTGAIRYGIAFDLAMFGFQKIFHLQFNAPLGMLDEPFSSFSKEWLTWSYFGRSYGFVVTIALSQIIGALLLVFNRTRLFGVVVLISVVLNIIFIDYFYELEMGVLTHALFLFAGLVQLLLLDYTRLVDFFFKDRSIDHLSLHTKGITKYIGRLSIIIIPLLLIAIYPSTDKHGLKGKYMVTDMEINGKPVAATNCADSLLSIVYLDLGNECVFEFNSQQRRMFGHYELDNGSMTTSWHFPPTAKDKEFYGVLKKMSEDVIEIEGVMNGDSIRSSLKRTGQ